MGRQKTIKNLVDMAGDNTGFKIITSDRDLGDTSSYTSVICGAWNQVGNDFVLYSHPEKSGYVQIARILRAKDYEVIYLNSFFSLQFSFFSLQFSFFSLLLAKVLRQRVVLGPRGELSEGALSLRSGKKRFFISVF